MPRLAARRQPVWNAEHRAVDNQANEPRCAPLRESHRGIATMALSFAFNSDAYGTGSPRGLGATTAPPHGHALAQPPRTPSGAPIASEMLPFHVAPDHATMGDLFGREAVLQRAMDSAGDHTMHAILTTPEVGPAAALETGVGERALTISDSIASAMGDTTARLREIGSTAPEPTAQLIDTYVSYIDAARTDIGRARALGAPSTLGEHMNLMNRATEYGAHTLSFLDALRGAAKFARI
jgi:hypothetical protein